MCVKNSTLFLAALLSAPSLAFQAEPVRISALKQEYSQSITCEAGTFKMTAHSVAETTEFTSIVWRGKQQEKIRKALNQQLLDEVVLDVSVYCVQKQKDASISVPHVFISFRKKPNSNQACRASVMLVFWRNRNSDIQLMGGLDCA